MERIDLLEPFLRDGLLNTNFFNGRLLSAEDLRTEQEAARTRAAQLGRAAGAGIVAGLRVARVSTNAPAGDPRRAVVSVSAGLGINRAGQLLPLPVDTEVALIIGDEDEAGPDAGLFAACQPPTTASVVAGAGAYVLTVRPASGYAGRAPASGLGGEPLTGPGCGSRYAVEGVRFKMVELNTAGNALIDAAAAKRMSELAKQTDLKSQSRLRNELAHACFGTARLDSFAAGLFAPDDAATSPPAYGALEALYKSGLLDACDLPLALVRWSQTGIDFVDEWAVRRRTTRAPALDRWSHLADDRRRADGEAAFRQFQDQLAWLATTSESLKTLGARDHFKYLPAAGFVPLGTPAGGGRIAGGFDLNNFFARLTVRAPVFVDGARLAPLVRQSAAHAPVDTDSGEFLWLYRVVQNGRARGAGASPREYVAYASGHVPWIGEARFDLARWDFSNYV